MRGRLSIVLLPMTITMDARIRVSPEVLLQEVGGEAVLLDLKSECYFGLDSVGTRIWSLIVQSGDVKGIHSTMLAEYDVEPARLEHDIKELISRLHEAGLVSIEAKCAAEG
jgi:hypothetical protein